jgi:WD40 repeat protein
MMGANTTMFTRARVLTKPLRNLRFWLALPLVIAGAVVLWHYPRAPRVVIPAERICWHLAFAPDGTKLAFLDREAGLSPAVAQVVVCDTATGAVLHRFDGSIQLYPSKLVFSPDGASLGLVDAGSVLKWDLNTGRLVAQYDQPVWSHDPDYYRGREILFSPEGRWLLHIVHEGRVYDVETGEIVRDYHEDWPDRSLTAFGGCVVAFVDGQVKTFNVLTGAEVGTFATAVKGKSMAGNVWLFSPDGSHGVYFDNQHQWVVCDGVQGPSCAWQIDFDWMPVDDGCCLSADHRFLAVALGHTPHNVFDEVRQQLSGSCAIHVLDTATGAPVGAPIPGARRCYFAPDGKTLAVADGRDQTVALWDWPSPSRRPQLLILAALAVLLFGVLGYRRRRRPGAAPTDTRGTRPSASTVAPETVR